MMFTNFLLFIAAIGIYSMSSVSESGVFPFPYNLMGVAILLLGFWHFNRVRFYKLRMDLALERISIQQAKKKFASMVDRHGFIALGLFSIEVFMLDIKSSIIRFPGLGSLETFINIVGLGLFVIHLTIIWRWAYTYLNDTFSLGKSSRQYRNSNIKFNMIILLPMILFSILQDFFEIVTPGLLDSINESKIAQVGIFISLTLVFLLLGPMLVTRFWDCKPLEHSEKKERIDAFIKTQRVKFKKVLSWNALGGSLATAGVIGIMYPFRYLMFTPELMRILDENELEGVTCHEVGHVKKNHILYYVLFIFAFTFLGIHIVEWIRALIFPFFLDKISVLSFINYFMQAVFIGGFILYIRFVLGYFMRNFERQADVYCFECGVDPNFLVSSFEKLGGYLGDDGTKSNWHHYNITERIEFLKKCQDSPGESRKHTRKVNRSLALFILILVLIGSWVAYNPADAYLVNAVEMDYLAKIKAKPRSAVLYAQLGTFYSQYNRWKESKVALEKSIELDYEQPDILNELAWMYLTCPDPEILDPQRALELSLDAVNLDEEPHIYDTLAEAYFQNGLYKEAFVTSSKALKLANDNKSYFRKQFEKMREYFYRFRNTMKI